jgi:hypothetical protein
LSRAWRRGTLGLTATESQQDRKQFRRKRDSHSQLSHSAALSCKLHIGVIDGIKVTVNLRERKTTALRPISGRVGILLFAVFCTENIWLSTPNPSAARPNKI